MSITRHVIASNTVSLGQRFITCTCGHKETSGAYDGYAEQNFNYHVKKETEKASEDIPAESLKEA